MFTGTVASRSILEFLGKSLKNTLTASTENSFVITCENVFSKFKPVDGMPARKEI